MNTYFLLVATTWMINAEVPAVTGTPALTTATTFGAPEQSVCCEERPGRLLGRLRGILSRTKDCGSECCVTGGGITSSMPASRHASAACQCGQVQTISPSLSPSPTTTTAVSFKVTPESASTAEQRLAHSPDYRWLTGQLVFVHAEGGRWVVRYAPISQEDRYGGSVVLARDIVLDSFREGDFVTVRGNIISEHASKFLGGPLYRVNSIELLERKPQ